MLDTKRYPELEQEGIAREIINRVQRLRKKAGLLPTDDIRMYYRLINDPENVLESVMKTQTLEDVQNKKDSEEIIAEEQQEVSYYSYYK